MGVAGENASESLVEAVREIDQFRFSTNEAGEGTDPDAAWELIDSLREKLAAALGSLGIDVPPYDEREHAGTPKP